MASTQNQTSSEETSESFLRAFEDARKLPVHRIVDEGPLAPVNERYCVIGLGPWYPRNRFSTVTECEDYCIQRNLDFCIELAR